MSVARIYICSAVMPSCLLFCCIYIDAWCVACCPKREEIVEAYIMIGEVFVLGLLVCKIPYSSSIRARNDAMRKL